ncbi:MAG: hypothetical protein HXX20_00560 [Chloroflexi bacterium]|nr:hypothetical protein [Chloroflexota bacterium]
MNLPQLVKSAATKTNFTSIEQYIDFCKEYLEFIADGLQATIVSQNENNYCFFQYRQEGYYNITRPINTRLMYSAQEQANLDDFIRILANIRDIDAKDVARRNVIQRAIYTIQQSIGAALDGLPSGESNTARKVNGDLFERFIQLLIGKVGISCKTGTMQVPVYVGGEFQFNMSYQHDLLLYNEDTLKVIGSVKTSSKDRIDKIFLDKFLYSKLTETALPHIAIFLNDVQRKKTKYENQYGINSTFLSGHFKAFSVKLNPLDGVYYCDIRPIMQQDEVLKKHIKTIDHFFYLDIWNFLN